MKPSPEEYFAQIVGATLHLHELCNYYLDAIKDKIQKREFSAARKLADMLDAELVLLTALLRVLEPDLSGLRIDEEQKPS